MRVRGLKPRVAQKVYDAIYVAPRAGAWVETPLYKYISNSSGVAPRAGAWVETRATILTLTLTGGRTPCGCVG